MKEHYPVYDDKGIARRIIKQATGKTVKFHEICVIPTGEKRKVKPGEWYISGAIPEGYYTQNGLSSIHVIGELAIKTKKEIYTYERII